MNIDLFGCSLHRAATWLRPYNARLNKQSLKRIFIPEESELVAGLRQSFSWTMLTKRSITLGYKDS